MKFTWTPGTPIIAHFVSVDTDNRCRSIPYPAPSEPRVFSGRDIAEWAARCDACEDQLRGLPIIVEVEGVYDVCVRYRVNCRPQWICRATKVDGVSSP